jgi:hypothetical protein
MNGDSTGLEQGGLIGELAGWVTGLVPEGALKGAERGALRRLGSGKLGPIERVGDSPGAVDPLDRLGDRDRGDGRAELPDRQDHGLDQRRRDEGTSAVVDQDDAVEGLVRHPHRQLGDRADALGNRLLTAHAAGDDVRHLGR